MRLRDLNTPRAWQLLLGCYWLTLFVLTHVPTVGPLSAAARHDKLSHAAAFTVLAALLAVTWQVSAGVLTAAQLRWAWLVVVVYAALDEWTQSFVGRYASVDDWVMDAMGAAFGLVLFAWVRSRIA